MPDEDKKFLIEKTGKFIEFYKVEIEKCEDLMNKNIEKRQYYAEKKRENEKLLNEAMEKMKELII